jgi:hypothetical protein
MGAACEVTLARRSSCANPLGGIASVSLHGFSHRMTGAPRSLLATVGVVLAVYAGFAVTLGVPLGAFLYIDHDSYTSRREYALAQVQRVAPWVGAVCQDGWLSPSTGSGTCSHHGGVRMWAVEIRRLAAVPWIAARGRTLTFVGTLAVAGALLVLPAVARAARSRPPPPQPPAVARLVHGPLPGEVSLQSTFLAAAAYSASAAVLRLRFLDGAAYAYKEVPEHVFRALVSSQSPGSYAHKHIFPIYEHERIDAD